MRTLLNALMAMFAFRAVMEYGRHAGKGVARRTRGYVAAHSVHGSGADSPWSILRHNLEHA